MADDFDVFLSYNSQDRATVLRIANHLKEYGLRPWLDVEELRPGLPWQDGLEEAIATIKAAAICVGPHGEGSWQTPEIRAFLSQMVERRLPVIPVLLPGAPEKPDLRLFLRENTWVDLRNGVTEEGLDRLVWGITGKKPEERSRRRSTAPPLHNLPFQSLGDLLKGRDDELRRLEAALDEPGGAAAITQSEAISGLGGIGKTRLAVEHAWRCGDRYKAAWFVRADSPEGLRRGLAALASPALLNLPERQAPAEEEIVGAVLRWLRENPGWLLIFDNVDTKEAAGAVLEILPSLSGGRILITSRLREWPANIRKQPLDTIWRKEAVQFLMQRTEGEREPADDDAEQADRLGDLLGDLPLALEQAAAYIAHNRMRFADYLEAWERERKAVLGWYDPQVMRYPSSVAVTWQQTFRQLDPMAGALLRLTAFLAPEPIPTDMFETGTEIVKEAAELLAEETTRKIDEQTVREAIAELATYSMIVWPRRSRLTVHRMVQEVLRSQVPAARGRDWIKLVLRVMSRFSPPDPSDVSTWPVWDLLRPHVIQIVEHADNAGITDLTSVLMGQLGVLLYAKSLYTKTESLMQEAEPLMRHSLALNERAFGPDHPKIATDLYNLARLLQATNRLDEAESLMRRVLAIDEATFGPEHPQVATRLKNLAQLLQVMKRPDEAKSLMDRALAIDEASFGPEHPDVARDLINLAMFFQDTNRLAEAEPLMRRAVGILEKSLGPDYPRSRVARRNLANLLQSLSALSPTTSHLPHP